MSAGGDGKGEKDWRRAVDDSLVRRCEQHIRDGERMHRPPRVTTYAAVPKLHVTPEDWGAGYLKPPREWDLPIQLVADLHECSPQSLLRDLYRPVREVSWHRFEPIEGTARDPLAGMAEARQARLVSTVPPRVEPLVRTVIAYMHWRIGMMAERWEGVLPDDSPRRNSRRAE